MEHILKAGVVFLVTLGTTKMEPLTVGFMLVLYVVPVLIFFAALAAIADAVESRRKSEES
jgi:hypothetical protein